MPDEETPNDDTMDEKKPEGNDTPLPPPPPSHPHHDIEGAIDKVSHKVESQMGIFEGLFSKPLILVGVMLGVILQFLGAILLNNDVSNGGVAVIHNLGVLIMVLVLFGGAITNEKLDPMVRLGMFAAGGIGIWGFNTWVY